MFLWRSHFDIGMEGPHPIEHLLYGPCLTGDPVVEETIQHAIKSKYYVVTGEAENLEKSRQNN